MTVLHVMYEVLHCQTYGCEQSNKNSCYDKHKDGDWAPERSGRKPFDLDVRILPKHNFGKLHATSIGSAPKFQMILSCTLVAQRKDTLEILRLVEKLENSKVEKIIATTMLHVATHLYLRAPSLASLVRTESFAT
jgi:hypothetical protein